MLVKTKGIVLRSIKYGETSIICDIYTRECGLKSFIVNGVRKAKSKTHASLFQVMTQLDLVIYDKNNQKLNRIKEVKIDKYYESLPFDIVRSSIGVFCIELCQKTIKEKESNVPLFDFIAHYFNQIDSSKVSLAMMPHFFLLDLSQFLGFRPNNNRSESNLLFHLEHGIFVNENERDLDCMSDECSAYLSVLLACSPEQREAIKIDKQNRKELLSELLRFYRYHVENFKELNSLKILEEVLS